MSGHLIGENFQPKTSQSDMSRHRGRHTGHLSGGNTFDNIKWKIADNKAGGALSLIKTKEGTMLMSRIFLTGDTHGALDIKRFYLNQFPESKTLTKDDYVIVLGDFGVIWDEPESDKTRELKNFYNSKRWTTLFCDGNHENHHLLSQYPVEHWNGGKIHRISDSIIHLMRGQIYNIDNKTFFVMGGASSIDKIYRKENISWWKEELPSNKEYQEAMDNLDKHNMSIDYVLTHCCSDSIQRQILYQHYLKNHIFQECQTDDLNRFFEHLEYDFGLNFKHWYFGHYHETMKVDDKHTCLYDMIIEI